MFARATTHVHSIAMPIRLKHPLVTGFQLLTILPCLALAGWPLLAAGAVAADRPANAAQPVTHKINDYVQVLDDPATGEMQLQFASRHLAPAAGKGPGVWLVGTTHMGTKEYYQKTQEFLDRMPVVLFEDVGIGKDGKKSPKDRAKAACFR